MRTASTVTETPVTETLPRGRAAERPSQIPPRGWKDIATRVRAELKEDHTSLAAAGVAFFGFLAVIPALAALVSVVGLVTEPDAVTQRADDLFGSLPSEARDLLTAQLDTLASRTSSSLSLSLVVSIALSLWSASSGMSHLIEGVNVAYDEQDGRNLVVKKAMSLAFTLGAIAFGVFTVVGLAALPAIVDALDLPGWLSGLLRYAFWPVLVVGFVLGLAVLYRHGPHRDAPKWRWVSWGSAVAVVIWLVASILFRVYAANFASYDQSYGSLAAVVVLLLWLYITAFAVLLGAQLNAEMEHQTAVDTTRGPERPLGQRGAVMADTIGRSSDGHGEPDETTDHYREGDRP
jgi:membrane protein